MATDPANEAQSSNCHVTNEQEQDATRPEKKLTVLESHGFILGKTIGAGNYATVKIARSEKHGCDVAVKIVSKFLAPSANLNTYLPREVQVIKRLRHANIIRFLQAIETSHRVYIIMEYAENGSLIDIIRRDRNIDEERARRWFRQLLNVLAFCHERGIVHRDVKCENLLMDRYYNLKLSDFGFARGQMKSQDGVAPLSETFCGSFAYASPEILRGIPYKPQLSDLWAAGVVLYTMVFGRLPFDESVWSKLLKQVQSKVVFPDTPKVSRLCRALIVRILVPQRLRPQIPEILSDEWMAIPLTSAQTSTNDIAFLGERLEPEKPSPKTIKSRKSSSSSNKSMANDENNNQNN